MKQSLERLGGSERCSAVLPPVPFCVSGDPAARQRQSESMRESKSPPADTVGATKRPPPSPELKEPPLDGGDTTHASLEELLRYKRIRSAALEELTFFNDLEGSEINGYHIRIWINSKNMIFYDCSCGNRRPVQDLSKIRKHAQIHVAKSHVCKHCGARFEKHLQLNGHMKIHSTKRSPSAPEPSAVLSGQNPPVSVVKPSECCLFVNKSAEIQNSSPCPNYVPRKPSPRYYEIINRIVSKNKSRGAYKRELGSISSAFHRISKSVYSSEDQKSVEDSSSSTVIADEISYAIPRSINLWS
jgi:hypothetical protein